MSTSTGAGLGDDRQWVVVAAKQIQPWLARSPTLKLMRGASRALRVLTSKADLDQSLSSDLASLGATVEMEGTTVDGVVTMTVADAAHASQVAERVVAHLGARLPGLTWEAWWTPAPDYPTAVARYRALDDAHISRLPQELPFAQTCPTCRQETGVASRTVVTPGTRDPRDSSAQKDLWMGPDCSTRSAFATNDQRWASVHGAWPEDFDELAKKGGRQKQPVPGQAPEMANAATSSASADRASNVVGRHRSSNHLATVCADGNRMGDLFEVITNAGPGFAGFRNDFSTLLDATLHTKVERAAAALSDGAAVKVGIPHYIGGDDVLVTIRAEAAWPFVAALMSGFDEIKVVLHQELDKVRPPAGAGPDPVAQHEARRIDISTAIERVSLGVGLAFSHSSHPFDACRHHGEAALRTAKQQTRGAESAVCWVDLTEGSHPTADRVLTAKSITILLATAPTGAGMLSSTARSQLRSLLATTPDEDREKVVKSWVKRTQSAEVDLGDLRQLPAELSRLRWWPAPPTGAPAGADARTNAGADS
jgi:hypothetical protein